MSIMQAPQARRCRGCGKTGGCDVCYASGPLAGYWHLKCVLKERVKTAPEEKR